MMSFLRKFYHFIRSLYRIVPSTVAKTYLHIIKVDYGTNLKIYSMPLCRKHPDGIIRIGDNVTIYNKLSENYAGTQHKCVLAAVSPNSRLIIGNNVGMSGVVLFCSQEIIIEDYVNLGAGSMIYDTDFHPIDADARRIHDITNIDTAPVRICKDVWIGANATILKGVTIGERSIVGAGSVVTKDVPPDSIVGGVPSKVIRKLNRI